MKSVSNGRPRPQRVRAANVEKWCAGALLGWKARSEEHLLVRVVPNGGQLVVQEPPLALTIDGIVGETGLLSVENDSAFRS